MLPALEDVIPHRRPMLLLDTLLSVSSSSAKAAMTIQADCLFLRPEGRLEPIAFIELLAQCFAAGCGVEHPAQWGYLAAIRSLHIYGEAKQGDTLRAETSMVTALGNILVVEGTLWKEEQCLAEGQFKIYLPETGA